jgi:phosphohistidine phosphatase
MNIYLLRHGIAVEPGTDGFTQDAYRPLTREGQRKLEKIGEGIGTLDLRIDKVLSSPYVRARETAAIVAGTLGLRKKLAFTEALIPEQKGQALVDVLQQLDPAPKSVMLVGHEPFMSDFISLLVWGQPGGSVLLRKGGLCKLSVESLEAGRCATLEWLLTPKQMMLMA